jgi:hypothetical protein
MSEKSKEIMEMLKEIIERLDKLEERVDKFGEKTKEAARVARRAGLRPARLLWAGLRPA